MLLRISGKLLVAIANMACKLDFVRPTVGSKSKFVSAAVAAF
jgi:hypothetical protein